MKKKNRVLPLVLLAVILLEAAGLVLLAGRLRQSGQEIAALRTELDTLRDGLLPWQTDEVPGESGVRVGDTVLLGRYEQDNDLTDGAETLEWQVLALSGNRALVISRAGLDCVPYHESYTETTWAACTLRKWLNGAFLTEAFTEEERAGILTVRVDETVNPDFETSGGAATADRVFILSFEEAAAFFASDAERAAGATAYAVARGAGTFASGNCWWWLRTPGHAPDFAAFVDCDGFENSPGNYVSRPVNAVRPAMWIVLH